MARQSRKLFTNTMILTLKKWKVALKKFDEIAINNNSILAELRDQHPRNTTYHIDSSIMNSLKDQIKSLESEIQFLTH